MPKEPGVMATGPTGFDRHYGVATSRANCRVGVGLDTERGTIERFLVQLEFRPEPESNRWVQIARVDHNPSNPAGHDLREEGVHVDVATSDAGERTVNPSGSIPHCELGAVLDAAVTYFQRHVGYFLDVHAGDVDPHDPPAWP